MKPTSKTLKRNEICQWQNALYTFLNYVLKFHEFPLINFSGSNNFIEYNIREARTLESNVFVNIKTRQIFHSYVFIKVFSSTEKIIKRFIILNELGNSFRHMFNEILSKIF